jgi:hypothetical protein
MPLSLVVIGKGLCGLFGIRLQVPFIKAHLSPLPAGWIDPTFILSTNIFGGPPFSTGGISPPAPFIFDFACVPQSPPTVVQFLGSLYASNGVVREDYLNNSEPDTFDLAAGSITWSFTSAGLLPIVPAGAYVLRIDGL